MTKIRPLIHCSGLLCALVLVSLLAGCDSDNEMNVPQGKNISGQIGMLAIFPQSIESSGWNKDGFSGSQMISEKLGLRLHHLESVPFHNEDQFRQIVGHDIQKKNIQIVMAHGGQYVRMIHSISGDFPRVQFVINTHCSGNNTNVGCLSFDWFQAGLIAGAAAALKSDTGKIGFIGGMPLSVLQQMADGMEQSARQITPDIELHRIWLDSWTDERQALDAARELIALGVDVISVNADPASKRVYPVLEAAGIAIVGRQMEQYNKIPETLLLNVRFNTQRLIEFGLEQMLLGRWEGKLHQFGIYDRVQSIELKKGQLTPEQTRRYDTFYHNILNERQDHL